jgi:hypothetical protein
MTLFPSGRSAKLDPFDRSLRRLDHPGGRDSRYLPNSGRARLASNFFPVPDSA